MTEVRTGQEPTCHFPLDRETRQLFGVYLTALRSQENISIDGLVNGTERTEEWVAAVEAGEIELTKEMVVDLTSLFREREIAVDIPNDLSRMQAFPFDSLANHLRTQRNVRRSIEAPPATDASPDEYELLGPTDRLLVVGPLILLASILAVISKALAWAIATPTPQPGAKPAGIDSLITVVNDLLIPGSVLAALAVALALQRAELTLRWVALRFRSEPTIAEFDAIKALTHKAAVTWDHEDSIAIDQVLASSVPRHRIQIRNFALRCALLERTTPILLIGSVVAIAAAIYSAYGGMTARDVLPIGLSGVLTVLFFVGGLKTDETANDYALAVRDGLGWRRSLQAA